MEQIILNTKLAHFYPEMSRQNSYIELVKWYGYSNDPEGRTEFFTEVLNGDMEIREEMFNFYNKYAGLVEIHRFIEHNVNAVFIPGPIEGNIYTFYSPEYKFIIISKLPVVWEDL